MAIDGATTGSGLDSVPSSQSFSTGITTVTYTVADAAGNNAVCNFSINVTDNTPPVWTGVGQKSDTTLTLNANMGGCMAQVTWMVPLFTDSCSLPVTVTPPALGPGSSFPFGPTTVSYTAIDGAGNVRVHSFTVVVVDTQNPNAQCKNITTYLNGAGTATVTAAQVDNLSTDNCSFSYTSPDVIYNCNNLGPNNYTLQLTDGQGNTATCVAVVTVADTIKPVANCALISTINLLPNGTDTLLASAVNNGSSDNTFPLCGLSYAISVNGSAFGPSFNFNCSHIGTVTLTLRVTDAAGNIATCSRSVLVRDVTPPAIVAPANVTISCDASSAPANTGTFSGVQDNCDPAPVVTLLPDMTVSVICANSYTIERRWRVTDASGNSATTLQTIVVQDLLAPVFNIQSAIELQTTSPSSCSVPFNLRLTQDSVSDNCTTIFANFGIKYKVNYPTPAYGFVDIDTLVTGSSILPASFPVGRTEVTWEVTDQCGHTATKTVFVTVKDVHGPAFSAPYTAANCGKTYVLPNTSGACSNLFAWARPNFLAPDITDCVNFTVSEQISNSTVSAFLNLTNQFNYNTVLPFGIFVTAQFPVDTTTITYLAQDSLGNQSACTITVIIEDTEAPVLTCPPNQTILATCPTAQVPSYTNQVGVADNCSGNVLLTQTYPAGTTLDSIFALPADSSVFTITMIGTDGYNNDTCSFTVMLLDGDAPIPTVDSLPDLIDSCGTLIVFAPTALDPCNPAADTIYATPSTPVGSFLNTNPPSYQLNPGSYVITWAYNDGNGNISNQPQNITVLNDVFPPVAICLANLTVDLHPVTGKAAIDPGVLNLNSFDPNMCGPLTFSVSPDTVTCAHVGPVPATVILTVRDLKGNPDTCKTAVTVRDITAPILSGAPANSTIEACDTIPAAVQLTSSDACAGISLVTANPVSTQNPVSGFQKYNYLITRTWTTADSSGNTAVVTRMITVRDTKKPVFTNAPAMVMVTTDPDRMSCDDTVSINILPFVSDCATGVDLTVVNNKEPADGGNLSAIFAVGTHVVTFTATDVSGNSQTHTVTVVVKDGTPPTAVCINGVSAALQPSGTVVVMPSQFNNNSSDNCPSTLDLKIQRLDEFPLQTPSGLLTYDCSDADGVTQHPVKLFVADGAGNMSMCETFIVIQDNVDPTFTLCPQNKTVPCTDSLSTQNHGMALATDNCPTNLMVSFGDLIVDDTSGQYCYKVERVWLAADLANNIAVCVQTFNIVDTVAPILSQYPPDVTISCSQNLAPPTVVTATDNCSVAVDVIFTQDTIAIDTGFCGQYSYTIQRTRTAVDDCGNVETHTNTITVVDNSAPTFPGLPDTILVQSVNFPTNDSCSVPVSLNATQFLVDCAPIGEMTVTNDAPHGDGALNASGSYAVGTYTIQFTATDPCGNVGIDSVVVVVIDNSKPTAICNNNVVISLGSDGTAVLKPEDINIGSTDNCDIDTMFLDKTQFDCANLGINPVTLTVVDLYGNENTCTVNVNVTLGNGVGFDLAISATPETFAGANDGTATAVATMGSGNFLYVWSTVDSTATIANLPPGIYFVTVTDLGSGCVRVDSVIVQAGDKLTIIAGTSAGMQGATVQVPVSVENFNDMIGISFSMHVINPIVGTIVDGTTTGVLPGLLLNKVGNDLTAFWVNNGALLDLPDGTVLFNLNVQLGMAPVGSTSPVTIDGTPTALSFQQDSSGSTVATMANLVPGMVMIDSLAANDIEIAGLIKTWAGAGTPVPDVNVALSGSVSNSVLTGAPGTYSFLVPPGSNTTVTPAKTVTSSFSQGINVGDLLAIQNHAASVNLFPNPYQYVAGDVNGNNMIDLVDYLLVQQLILGTVQHYSNGAPDWKFIPSAYIFPTPNPLSAPYPQNIMHTPANMSFLNDDFTAVRMGDVTGNAPVNNIVSNTQDRSGDVFRFRIDEQPVRAGDLIPVSFKARDFTARQAYQMTIGFDPNTLELTDIQPGALPNFGMDNFGMAHVADGNLTNLWISSNPLTLNDGEVLFTLTFRALENSAALSNVLHPTSTVTAAEALDAAGNSMEIEFEFAQVLSNDNAGQAAPFVLYQNQPNPFREQTTIGFSLPQAGRAVLRVFSMDGRLVKTVVGNFAQGFNTVILQKDELGAGVYWYKLDSDTNSDRKKMILID
ncbi:MAG: HYR domain-containing protein [Lewinellaceae bacterium]|nr:HYR domain-containing protein [Lewinellaceae bacterium]